MKVLITGFDPFNGETINPAYEAIKLIPETLGGVKIIKLEVPTVFKESGQLLKSAIQKEQPDIVICVGQAGGRCAISLEQVAINLIEARIPDNKGNQPIGEKIEKNGETAYFSSLPIKAMMKNIHEHGLPASISYTAGTFVCNELMYRLLFMIDREFIGIKGGFIHVPFVPEQVAHQSIESPSMSVDLIAKALTYAIEAAVKGKEDQAMITGIIH